MRASVVGRPCRPKPADEPSHDQHLLVRGESSHQACRHRKASRQDEHQLRPVAVTDRAEVQKPTRRAQRVADRDEVERGLRRAKALPMSGKATFATSRFRFATAATRMSAIQHQIGARAGNSGNRRGPPGSRKRSTYPRKSGPTIECAASPTDAASKKTTRLATQSPAPPILERGAPSGPHPHRMSRSSGGLNPPVRARPRPTASTVRTGRASRHGDGVR